MTAGTIALAIPSLFAAVTGLNDGGVLVSTSLRSVTVRPVRTLTALGVAMAVGPYLFGTRELLRRLDVVGIRIREAADILADESVKRGY